MKYRKKPVVVEAIQLQNGQVSQMEIVAFTGGRARMGIGFMTIATLEGDHRADIGDFIIKGVKGEFYPCKPDIFKATYDLVADEHEPGEERSTVWDMAARAFGKRPTQFSEFDKDFLSDEAQAFMQGLTEESEEERLGRRAWEVYLFGAYPPEDVRHVPPKDRPQWADVAMEAKRQWMATARAVTRVCAAELAISKNRVSFLEQELENTKEMLHEVARGEHDSVLRRERNRLAQSLAKLENARDEAVRVLKQ